MSSIDLAAARRGDERAFEQLFEPHRAALQAHCYRMLGSAADAEDAVQEVLVRAWRGLGRFEGRSAIGTWLYRIATNVCLTMIERRPRRVLPLDSGPASDPHTPPDGPVAEPVWLEPYPDATTGGDSPEARYEQRESVELAFVAALQHLPGRQRAALLLRDVLGFEPAEIASALNTTPTAVYSSLQRARRAVDERLPAVSQQATLRALGDERLQELVTRYVQAWEQADVTAIVELLAADATYSMPPRPSWYRGRVEICAFLRAGPAAVPGRWLRVPVRANGQPAFAVYDRPTGAAHAIQVLTVGPGGLIAAVTSFQQPAAFARFGLPGQAHPEGAA